jgi:transcriptional regulator with XRE-family HTH domain
MTRRPAVVELGRLHGQEVVALVAREFRIARLDRGLSQRAVAAAVGIDRSSISRIERGRAEDLSLVTAAELLAAVGLELSVRAYPAGAPLRDAAHADLLRRFRARLHRSLDWATEVPLPIPGDLRAWDAMVTGDRWRCGIEAETRPRDGQALERRIALKQRDGEVDFVILLLLDSRHNRAFVREHADLLHARFPVAGARALELLGAGVAPGGNAVVLL